MLNTARTRFTTTPNTIRSAAPRPTSPPVPRPAEAPLIFPRKDRLPQRERKRETSTEPSGGSPEFMKPILSDDGDPHVLVVGASGVDRAIVAMLRRIGVDARHPASTAEALHAMTPWTRAIVFAPPLPRLMPETAVPVLERPAHAAAADMLLVVPDTDDHLHERADAIAEDRDIDTYSWPSDAPRLTHRLRDIGRH